MLNYWFNGMLQDYYKKVHGPLRMHDIQTCEEALQKAQQIETDDDWPTLSTDRKMEEKLRCFNNI
jgi:hypothetical protein